MSTPHKKSSLNHDSTNSSQLLRRLVTSQIPSVASSSSNTGASGEHRRDVLQQHIRVLDNIIDLAETEGDRGGGGGGGGNHDSDGFNKIDATSRGRTPICGGSSVLMNLLVSGCDVSAGYVCLVKSKPTAKSIANA